MISTLFPGRFITLEGMDGAGKSTQLQWIEKFLLAKGKTAVVTREPGGTPLGEKLRELLLNADQPMHPETEALLMFAARREHLDKVIFPALERGDWVVSDRFTDASFAYQGGGRGMSSGKIENLEAWVHAGFQPDLTLYFDVPIEVGRQRASAVKSPDRFEKERDEFFRHVRAAYLERASRFPSRIHVIDASVPADEVAKSVEGFLSSICP